MCCSIEKTSIMSLAPIRYVLVGKDARPPTQVSEMACGYDLCAAETITVRGLGLAFFVMIRCKFRNFLIRCQTLQSNGIVGGREQVSLGLRLEIPHGVVGMLVGKSGLARNYGIFCHVGILDSDFRGLVSCLLSNSGLLDYEVRSVVIAI